MSDLNAMAYSAQAPDQEEVGFSEAMRKNLADTIFDTLSKNPAGPVKANAWVAATQVGLKDVLNDVMQRLLDLEMSTHIGAGRYERINNDSTNTTEESQMSAKPSTKRNYRNGSYNRKVKTNMGEFMVKMPRDRDGSFQPSTVPKYSSPDTLVLREEILKLASMGNSVRDIQESLCSLLKVDVNKTYVQEVIDSFQKEYEQWQMSSVEAFYPFLFVDCLYVDVRNQYGLAQNKPVYVILGINAEGRRSILDIAMSEKSSAETKSFWLSRFDKLKQRGLQDLLFVSMDGVAGLEEGVKALFPGVHVQRCVVHLVRNSLQFVDKKDRYKWCADLKKIYAANSEDAAFAALEQLRKNWSTEHDHAKVNFVDERFISHISPLFELPSDIRKLMYTTNSIESVNSSLRKVIKKGIFGSERSVVSKLYLRVVHHLDPMWEGRRVVGWTKVLNQLMLNEKTRQLMAKHLPYLAE